VIPVANAEDFSGIVKQRLLHTAEKLSPTARLKRTIGSKGGNFMKRYIESERRIGESIPYNSKRFHLSAM